MKMIHKFQNNSMHEKYLREGIFLKTLLAMNSWNLWA